LFKTADFNFLDSGCFEFYFSQIIIYLSDWSLTNFHLLQPTFLDTEPHVVPTGVRRVLGLGSAPVPVTVVQVAHEAAHLVHHVHLLHCLPVCDPLPHISDHVLMTELGDGKLGHWVCLLPPIIPCVGQWEFHSPDVRKELSPGITCFPRATASPPCRPFHTLSR
jgi:hypothetical protein